MKDIFKKNLILIISIIYLIIFILVWIILAKLKYSYLFWFKVVSGILIIIGIIFGTVKFIKNIDCDRKVKITLYVLYILVELFISVIFMGFILFPLLYEEERIVSINNKWYVEVRHSFLLSNYIDYYEFNNIIFRSNKPKITKDYNNTLDDSDYIDTKYYDDEENVDEYDFEEEVLYTKKFEDNTIIKITKVDVILGQRNIIILEKSTDGGKTFENQLSNKSLTVYNNSEFLFFNSQLGFINEHKDGNKNLLVTRDGGRTFDNIILNVDSKTLDYLYIEKMPYYDKDTLKLDVSLYYSKTPEIKTLISIDNGLTWN